MRKRTIALLYLLAALLNLWGMSYLLAFLFESASLDRMIRFDFSGVITGPFLFFDVTAPSASWFDISHVLLPVEISVLLLAGTTLSILAWVAVLIQHAKAQRWGWFILTIFFSGILLIIYLLSDLPPASVQPGLLPWVTSSPSPQVALASQRRLQLFRSGLIAGGIIGGGHLFWCVITTVLAFVAPQIYVHSISGNFTSSGVTDYAVHAGFAAFHLGLPGVSLAVFNDIPPLLFTLAAFFWVGKWAVQRTNQASAGIDIALRAFLWLLITLPIIAGADSIALMHYTPLSIVGDQPGFGSIVTSNWLVWPARAIYNVKQT